MNRLTLAFAGLALVVVGTLLHNQWQLQQEVRQLRQHLAQTPMEPTPPEVLPPLPPTTEPLARTGSEPPLANFRAVFLDTLAADLITRERSADGKQMIRSGLGLQSSE